METSLYYTFSTIAQALAALMGLLGAFALFRLQSMETEIEDRVSRLSSHFNQNAAIQDSAARGRYKDFLTAIDSQLLNSSFGPADAASLSKLRLLIPERLTMLASLILALAVTAITTVGSVYVLTIVTTLGPEAQTVLLCGVCAFGLCIALQLVLVLLLVR